MACGSCGGGRKNPAKKDAYLATFPDGTKKAYSTEIEAQLAVARKGGSYKKN